MRNEENAASKIQRRYWSIIYTLPSTIDWTLNKKESDRQSSFWRKTTKFEPLCWLAYFLFFFFFFFSLPHHFPFFSPIFHFSFFLHKFCFSVSTFTDIHPLNVCPSLVHDTELCLNSHDPLYLGSRIKLWLVCEADLGLQ